MNAEHCPPLLGRRCGMTDAERNRLLRQLERAERIRDLAAQIILRARLGLR